MRRVEHDLRLQLSRADRLRGDDLARTGCARAPAGSDASPFEDYAFCDTNQPHCDTPEAEACCSRRSGAVPRGQAQSVSSGFNPATSTHPTGFLKEPYPPTPVPRNKWPLPRSTVQRPAGSFRFIDDCKEVLLEGRDIWVKNPPPWRSKPPLPRSPVRHEWNSSGVRCSPRSAAATKSCARS